MAAADNRGHHADVTTAWPSTTSKGRLRAICKTASASPSTLPDHPDHLNLPLGPSPVRRGLSAPSPHLTDSSSWFRNVQKTHNQAMTFRIPIAVALGSAVSLILVLFSDNSSEVASRIVPWRSSTHPLLASVFVAITFNWNVEKLAYLRMTNMAVKNWRTRADICVISNAPERLQRVFDMWQMEEPGRFSLSVCRLHSPGGWDRESEKYGLVWKHREVFERAYREGQYTTYVYLEDDTEISWPAMQSWAADTEVLEPLGFQRGFYRTEIHPTHGRAVLLDMIQRTNLSLWERLVHLELPRPCRLMPGDGDLEQFWTWREAPAGCQHLHYISPLHPYYGMWIATHAKLGAFMRGPYWKKEDALAADIPDPLLANGSGLNGWGYPERSTGMIQFVDVPDGFWSASVLPYDPEHKVLLPVAHIEHERNGYAGGSRYLSRLRVTHAFLGVGPRNATRQRRQWRQR